jgi:hypothetical protein
MTRDEKSKSKQREILKKISKVARTSTQSPESPTHTNVNVIIFIFLYLHLFQTAKGSDKATAHVRTKK